MSFEVIKWVYNKTFVKIMKNTVHFRNFEIFSAFFFLLLLLLFSLLLLPLPLHLRLLLPPLSFCGGAVRFFPLAPFAWAPFPFFFAVTFVRVGQRW